MQKKDQIVIAIFGDRAANEGVFHEAMNMAALWKLPILYICENNQYGMSMPVNRAAARLPIAQRADAYGVRWNCVDGNDALAVYEVMKEAANYVRSGQGPILVEADTYRYFGHSKSDRNLYRTKDEIEFWKQQKDPIEHFKGALVEAAFLTEAQAAEIELEAEQILEQAVEFAENSPEPDISSVTEFVYA
jgi:pyruvate dehydrogenase E1 component alpha subunit